MSQEARQDELAPNRTDYVAAAAKSIVGVAPFAGSLLVEIAGTVIPNQRVDRIARFAIELEARIGAVEQDVLRRHLNDEYFTDLIEEGLRQAARSITDERRSHIASLIANSINSEDVSFVEAKHLLRLLDEMNDIEIIRLGRFQFELSGTGMDYWERHREVLEPVGAHSGSSQLDIDRETIQESYDAHLEQLGLIEDRTLSRLGRLLSRDIGLLQQSS